MNSVFLSFFCNTLSARSRNLKMFTEDQKKFIVKAFGRNPSPTEVKQEFLREYKIEKGRPTAKHKLYQFSRVNDEFEKR